MAGLAPFGMRVEIQAKPGGRGMQNPGKRLKFQGGRTDRDREKRCLRASAGNGWGVRGQMRGRRLDELTREFLIESQEGLDRMERCLTDLEERPQDTELLGEIFRSVHTITGTTGFLGFKRLEKLAHIAHAQLVRRHVSADALDLPKAGLERAKSLGAAGGVCKGDRRCAQKRERGKSATIVPNHHLSFASPQASRRLAAN